MKQRLFWKILISFWLTLICMMQLVWGVYYVTSGDATSYERAVAIELAPYKLALAQAVIEDRGTKGFRLYQTNSHLPNLRNLNIIEHTSRSQENFLKDTKQVTAVDPDGRRWIIVLTLPKDVGRFSDDRWKMLGLYMPPEWTAPSVFGGLLFSALLAWYLSRPIHSLREGFRSLANGNLGIRLRPEMGSRRDEIADLSSDFDRMAERLQHLVQIRDQLLHDVSHELRSPLARLSLAVALVRQSGSYSDESLERIDVEVARLDGLVGELLSLARYENGECCIDAYFEIQELLEALVDDVRFEAQAKEVEIDVQKLQDRPLLIQGSAELIRRALENVIRNALQFSTFGQRIDVRVSTSNTEEPQVLIEIGDRGPGVLPDQLERMLEPFIRLEGPKQREGYGLGLSIAQRALQSHGGEIRPMNRTGGGLLMTIVLPLAKINAEMFDAMT